MKKILVLATLLVASIAGNAEASWCDRAYFGAEYLHSGIFERNRHAAFGFSESKGHGGAQIFLGLELCRCFALEGGYAFLGNTHLNDNLDVNTADGNTGSSFSQYTKRKTYSFPLRLVWRHRLHNCLDFIAFGGVHYYRDRYSELAPQFQGGNTPHKETFSGVDFHYGLGFEYQVWCNLKARVTFNKYEFNHAWNDKESINVGLVYHF